MKTYSFFCVIFVLAIFSCSKSDNSSGDGGGDASIDTDYVTLLSKDGLLKSQLFNANAERITLNPTESTLTEKTVSELSVVDGSYFVQYHKDGDCGGQITQHDFKSDTSTEILVFTDLNDCDLTATAIAKSKNHLFVSYQLTSSDSETYLIRTIDLNSPEFNSVDITVDKKPVSLTFANDRLFILKYDASITKEYSLVVLNTFDNTLIHEMGLGNSVRRIFTDTQDNVIISYDELHTTLNSSTMAFKYTQYEDSTAPKFSDSKSVNFDSDGRLFYAMKPGANSDYQLVPAIYDFSKKLVVLYAYENFLTETKRNFEYEIETTTAVSYDEKNGLMLVGYRKMGGAIKEGGLLRIKLAPDPVLIDNIDLDGVPTYIVVN